MAGPAQRRLSIEHRLVDPRVIELAPINARFMTHDQYQRLVANVKRDGYLTSSPLLYWPPDRERPLCLSGNHRTRASIDAGLDTIDTLVCLTPLTPSEQTAMQLAHNAVEGQDDPSTLRALFDSITEVDDRLYSGLDDAGMDLLVDLDMPGLSDAAPRWHTLTFLFLDDEVDKLDAAFKEAEASVGEADSFWLARLAQFDALLDHLQTVQGATNISNRAFGLQRICDVFHAHVTDLAADLKLAPQSDSLVPLAAIVGYDVPAKVAVRLRAALHAIDPNDPVGALDVLIARSLTKAADPG